MAAHSPLEQAGMTHHTQRPLELDSLQVNSKHPLFCFLLLLLLRSVLHRCRLPVFGKNSSTLRGT